MAAGSEHEFTPDAPLILMDTRDNVATALMPLEPGQTVAVALEGARYEVAVRERIPFGHKVALALVPAGTLVIKYGETIGRAAVDIYPGYHVHVHNIEGTRGRGDLAQKEG